MVTRTKLFATLGVGAIIATGVLAAGSTPANADSLRIGDYHGRVGFSLNIGTPEYYGPTYVAPVCAPPVYVAPSYYIQGGRDWHGDRDNRGRGDFRGRDDRGGHDRR